MTDWMRRIEKVTRNLHPAGEKAVESIWQERFNHPCVGGLFTISTDPDGCKTCGMSRLKYESLMDEAKDVEAELRERDNKLIEEGERFYKDPTLD